MKRAILYARVSTDQQADKGYSLPTQLTAMRGYAAEHGFEIVGEFSDDFTGTKPVAERPEGRKLYDAMHQKCVDAIVLYTIDRAARDEDVLEFGIFKRDCKRAGVELHFVDTGKVSDTIWGGMMEHFKAAAAAEERQKIIERTTRGRRAKAAQGKWVGTCKPYGYKRVGSSKDSRLEVDPETSKVVRRIFDMMLGRNGYKAHGVAKIARALSRDGIPSSYGNQVWAAASVYVMLKNPMYVGQVSYKGHVTEIPELAIISREQFDAVQVKLKENKHYSPRNRKRDYLLAGRFLCVCGKSRIGFTNNKNGRTYVYYICKDKPYRHSLGCVEKNIHADIVEGRVWEKLVSEFDEDTIREGVRARIDKMRGEIAPKKERLKSIREELERDGARLNKLLIAYTDCEDEEIAASYKDGIASTTKHRNALLVEQTQVENEIEQLEAGFSDEAYVDKCIRAVKQKLESGKNPTFQEKRAIIDLLDVKCQLTREGGKLGVSGTYVLSDEPFIVQLDSKNSPIESKRSQAH